jgi:hypothetical protein
VLKGLVSRFALDGKEFGGHKFEWSPYSASGYEFLRLKDVAVTFSDRGDRNGVPQTCRARFTSEAGGVGPHVGGRQPPLEWSLDPVIEGESVAWSIPELRETLSSADLAEKIAIELSKYHAAYEEAHGRWPAV